MKGLLLAAPQGWATFPLGAAELLEVWPWRAGWSVTDLHQQMGLRARRLSAAQWKGSTGLGSLGCVHMWGRALIVPGIMARGLRKPSSPGPPFPGLRLQRAEGARALSPTPSSGSSQLRAVPETSPTVFKPIEHDCPSVTS